MTSVRIERFAVALRLADLTEHGGAGRIHREVVGRERGELVGAGPRRPVDRTLTPPRPHFLGHERHVRREQPQQRVERGRERGACRVGAARRRGPSPARGSRRRSSRRTARSSRAPVRSRRCRTTSSRSSTSAASAASIERSSGSVIASRPQGTSSPMTPSANFDALRILIASRRPTFIWPSSTAVSTPGRPLAAQ